MNILVLTIIIIGALMITLLSGAPVAFGLFGLSIIFGLIFIGTPTLFMTFTSLFGNMSQELYLSVPLFVLMACMLESSGIASDLYETMYKWMAGLKGGLAMGTCIICALIDAMSGVGATATITMGVLALPEMLKRGYNKDLAIGCIPCGGALGPLIPPSVIMIIMGGLTGISVGKLFIGGLIPGLIITALFCLYVAVRCIINPSMGPPVPLEERATWTEKFIILKRVIMAVLLIALIMGSIYSGACTPTEAGGVGAAGTFLVILIRRKLTRKVLTEALYMTMSINGMVLWLLIGGSSFAAILNSLGISDYLANYLSTASSSTSVVVLIMLTITLFLGCFIDGASILMICTPVFFSVVNLLKVEPIWFGVLFTTAIVVGYVTPPFGMNLFFMKGLVPEGVTMKDIWRSAFPYTAMMVLGLALCFYFPIIITYLPNLMK